MAVALRTLICVAVVACASPAALGAPPTDEVTRMAGVIARGAAAGDVDAIAALYAPAAILLAPDGSIAARREGIRAAYAANQARGANRMEFSQIQVDGDDLQAVAIWVWTLTISPPGQAPVATSGRSMVYMKRQPEGWQIFADMYQLRAAR